MCEFVVCAEDIGSMTKKKTAESKWFVIHFVDINNSTLA